MPSIASWLRERIFPFLYLDSHFPHDPSYFLGHGAPIRRRIQVTGMGHGAVARSLHIEGSLGGFAAAAGTGPRPEIHRVGVSSNQDIRSRLPSGLTTAKLIQRRIELRGRCAPALVCDEPVGAAGSKRCASAVRLMRQPSLPLPLRANSPHSKAASYSAMVCRSSLCERPHPFS